MRKKWPGFTLVLVASLLTALFVPARAFASPSAPAAAAAVSKSVPAKGWVNTGVNVKAGQELRITAAGTWTDGSTTSGPNGSSKLNADNFFNIADLGVCNYCATTATTGWGALVGYIGASPPAQGSYTSAAIRAKAISVFYVGGSYEAKALTTGTLWLGKNADAYSGYTVDNSGHVTAKVTVFPAQTASQIAAQARTTALAVSLLHHCSKPNRCLRPGDSWAPTKIRSSAESSAGTGLAGALRGSHGSGTTTLEFQYEASGGRDLSTPSSAYGKAHLRDDRRRSRTRN